MYFCFCPLPSTSNDDRSTNDSTYACEAHTNANSYTGPGGDATAAIR